LIATLIPLRLFDINRRHNPIDIYSQSPLTDDGAVSIAKPYLLRPLDKHI
jgi:hypothetical protein